MPKDGSMSESKKKILEAASKLFLEGGAKAMSVRAIATKAGVSTIGIYSHFNGKQGILDTLFIEATQMVSAAMDAGNGAPTPKAAMMANAEAYLDMAEQHYAHYRLFFGESDPDYTPSEEAQDLARAAFKKLRDHAAKLHPAGAPGKDIQETALTFWALLHGFVGLTRHMGATRAGVEDWRALIMRTVEEKLDTYLK